METTTRIIISFISFTIGFFLAKTYYKTKKIEEDLFSKTANDHADFIAKNSTLYNNSGLSFKNVVKVKYHSLCILYGKKNIAVYAWVFLAEKDKEKMKAFSEEIQVEDLSNYAIDGLHRVLKVNGITCIIDEYNDKGPTRKIQFMDTPSCIWFFDMQTGIDMDLISKKYIAYQKNDVLSPFPYIEFFTL